MVVVVRQPPSENYLGVPDVGITRRRIDDVVAKEKKLIVHVKLNEIV